MFTSCVARLTHHVLRIAYCLVLVACANGSPTNTRALAPTTHQPVTLTLWHAYTDTPAALVQSLVNDFHKTYPTITVRVEAKANDAELLRQGLAAIALNQMPDVVIADARILAEFARRGALTPLDAWMNDRQHGLRDDERADFFPGLLDAGRFPELKHQTLLFPFDHRAVVLYYNVEMLQAKTAVPRTWEQFGEAVRLTTRGNVRGWVMSPDALVFYAFLFSRGGSVLDDTQQHARLADDAGLKAVQLIVALTKSGAAYLADSEAHARAEFAQGKAAFWFGDTDNLARLAEAALPFKWGVTNIPQADPRRPITAQHGASIAIFQTTAARVRAAWLLTRWLTMPEASAQWTQFTLRVPVRLSAYAQLAPQLPSSFLRLREGFGDALPTLRAIPTVKEAATMDTLIVEMWTRVANGADPITELKNAAARVNRLLGNLP